MAPLPICPKSTTVQFNFINPISNLSIRMNDQSDRPVSSNLAMSPRLIHICFALHHRYTHTQRTAFLLFNNFQIWHDERYVGTFLAMQAFTLHFSNWLGSSGNPNARTKLWSDQSDNGFRHHSEKWPDIDKLQQQHQQRVAVAVFSAISSRLRLCLDSELVLISGRWNQPSPKSEANQLQSGYSSSCYWCCTTWCQTSRAVVTYADKRLNATDRDQ